MFGKDTLVDWQREANEEMKTLRFCPNCSEIVQLKFKEHKYYQNFYLCPKCGETILSRGLIRIPQPYGYTSRYNKSRY
ncbi:MAG: hypothetical protein ACFFDW_04945 [Candidatus Thorarchaeota archaeon]